MPTYKSVLYRLPVKVGEQKITALVNPEKINLALPFESSTHIYIENIATPLIVLLPFDKYEAFVHQLSFMISAVEEPLDEKMQEKLCVKVGMDFNIGIEELRRAENTPPPEEPFDCLKATAEQFDAHMKEKKRRAGLLFDHLSKRNEQGTVTIPKQESPDEFHARMLAQQDSKAAQQMMYPGMVAPHLRGAQHVHDYPDKTFYADPNGTQV